METHTETEKETETQTHTEIQREMETQTKAHIETGAMLFEGIEFEIIVEQYNVVNPFGQEGQ